MERRILDMTREIAHENEDPVNFPPLLRAVREAEIQTRRAEMLCKLAVEEVGISAQDKVEITNALQNARETKAQAQRNLKDFLKKIGDRKAKTYLGLAQMLQMVRKRSLVIRRWLATGLLLETDACYEAITKRSAELLARAQDAAPQMMVWENVAAQGEAV